MGTLENNILRSLINIIKNQKAYVSKLSKKHNVNKKIWNKLISSKFKPELKKSIKNITNNHELKKVFKKVYTDKKFKKQIEKDKTIFFLFLQIIKTNMNK